MSVTFIYLRLIIGFQETSYSFNSYFTKQCLTININSSLPSQTHCLYDINVFSTGFYDQDIFKIIWILIIKRSQGHQNRSTLMIKDCDSAFVKSLSIIFQSFLNFGISSDNWKRPKMTLVQKKGNKQQMQKYSLVPLLSVSSKCSV